MEDPDYLAEPLLHPNPVVAALDERLLSGMSPLIERLFSKLSRSLRQLSVTLGSLPLALHYIWQYSNI